MITKRKNSYIIIAMLIVCLSSCYSETPIDKLGAVSSGTSYEAGLSNSQITNDQAGSSLLSAAQTIPTEDPQLVPVYQFFYKFYGTYSEGVVQNFAGILEDNENTFLFQNYLRYELYKQSKNKMRWVNYCFELSDIIKTQNEKGCFISVTCKIDNTYVLDDEECSSSGVVPYAFVLEETDGTWLITSIEEAEHGLPNFLENFRKQIDALEDKNKTKRDNIANATDYLMDTYE